MVYSSNNTEGLTFPQIILKHVNKILELSFKELRISERVVTINATQTVVETEDLRKSYCQAVKNLSFVLIPYFDKDMKKAFDEDIIFLRGFGYEIIEKITDEDQKKRLSDVDDKEKSNFLTMIQVRHAEHLFIELNKLLRRVEYLGKSIFGESNNDDNEIIDDEEESD